MTLFWGRVECEAAVGSNVRSIPPHWHIPQVMNARTVQALGVEKSLVAMYVGRLRAKQHGAVAAWGWRKTM